MTHEKTKVEAQLEAAYKQALAKQKVAAVVAVTTIADHAVNGGANAIVISASDYTNKADFETAAKAKLTHNLGAAEGELVCVESKQNFDDLGCIQQAGIHEDYWALITVDDVFTLQKAEIFTQIYGLSNHSVKATIQDAIDRYQGFWMNDCVCVKNYIAEYGSLEEADPDLDPTLSTAEITAHFMKNISSLNDHYFND